MKLHAVCVPAQFLLLILTLCHFSGGSCEGTLLKMLKQRNVPIQSGPAADIPLISQAEAKGFLSIPRRSRRNLWDRSRPDVQQWIQQFMYMGYDEARLETDLSHWMDHAKSRDQGGQHHYDENAAMSSRDHSTYRHGANVNYDYY